MNEYIKSDLYRYCGNSTFKSFLREFRKNKAFRHMVGVRLASRNKKYMWIYKLLKSNTISITPQTKIGYGLYIGHGSVGGGNRELKCGNW